MAATLNDFPIRSLCNKISYSLHLTYALFPVLLSSFSFLHPHISKSLIISKILSSSTRSVNNNFAWSLNDLPDEDCRLAHENTRLSALSGPEATSLPSENRLARSMPWPTVPSLLLSPTNSSKCFRPSCSPLIKCHCSTCHCLYVTFLRRFILDTLRAFFQ